MNAPPERRATLRELAALFLRLGCTAFGGPAAHIAMMEDEVVVRRRWLTPERFLDMLSAANLIPGPSSSELAVFIGYDQAGLAGLVVAGVCFVLPAAVITAAIAWAYVRYGALPHASGVLYGIKPVVIAIVVQALWGLAPKALKKSKALTAFAVLAGVAAAAGADAVAVLLGTGALSLAVYAVRTRSAGGAKSLLMLSPATTTSPATSATLAGIFLAFAKLGAVVFGSGYVLVAFLREDLVVYRHWLTEAQLMDAVAVGQVTPGPVFTTATFIGYVLAGGPGAAVATIAIFLPGFLLVAAIRPLVARVRRYPAAGAFLDGVNVASLALMGVVGVQLGRSAIIDAPTAVLALVSAFVLLRTKVSSTWLILGGALAGLILSFGERGG